MNMKRMIAKRCNPDGDALIEHAPPMSGPVLATVWQRDGFVATATLLAAAPQMADALVLAHQLLRARGVSAEPIVAALTAAGMQP